MAGQNAELARRATDAFNETDIEDWLDFYDPEVEATSTVLIDADQVYRGHEGLRRLVEISFEDFEDVRIEVVELIERGDDVVTLTYAHGRGKGSGMPVSREVGYVFTVRDGKVLRLVSVPSWAEAREHGGLTAS
jgi:ketosteroid isomerase-like protein